MPDPNARRDAALAAIAGELKETNKLLAKIEKNTRPQTWTFNNSPEQKSGPADPNPHTGPYGVGIPFA